VNRKFWLATPLILAALITASCVPNPPSLTSTTTPTASTTTTPPTIANTTVALPPTTSTKTTASLKLYIPQGQQFRGVIARGAAQVDTAPFIAYGGAPASGYTWSLASGSTLPPGTTFNPATGMFYADTSGAALVPGTHTFSMVVSDGSNTATGAFSLVVSTDEFAPIASFQKSLAPNITLPDAKVGMGYGVSLWAVGNGNIPWTWNIMSGELPPGLKINTASGVIYGTPLPSGAGKTYEFRISVKDAIGADAIGEPTYAIIVTN